MIQEKYNIEDKKVLLYAPTFRNDFSFGGSSIDFDVLKSALDKNFGGDWIILMKLHPMVAEKCNIENKNVMNVSFHEDMQELLCTADILITDYSSCMWDFSLLKRPVFIFADDIEEYTKKDRAFYMSCEKWPYPIAKNNEQLIKSIIDFDLQKYLSGLENHFHYVESYDKGNSCKEIFDYIITKC